MSQHQQLCCLKQTVSLTLTLQQQADRPGRQFPAARSDSPAAPARVFPTAAAQLSVLPRR